jgi:ribosomal-protein-alanine N-acetyltransferase
MLLTAMERILELGFSVVSLEVRPTNQAAQHLYRKYGFRFTGVHQAYYRDGEDAWLMMIDVGRNVCQRRLAELRHALEARICQHWEGVGQNNADTL